MYNLEALERLKYAVVLTACDDWLKAATALKKAKPDGAVWIKNKAMKDNCERFFFSDRFALFTDIDPFALLDRLEELAEQGRRNVLRRNKRISNL